MIAAPLIYSEDRFPVRFREAHAIWKLFCMLMESTILIDTGEILNGMVWQTRAHVKRGIEAAAMEEEFRRLYRANHRGQIATDLSGGEIDGWTSFAFEDIKNNAFIQMLVNDVTFLVSVVL